MPAFGETRICPICGKSFPPASEHSLTDGKGHLVCSPHCSTAAYMERQKRKQEARERAKQRQAEKTAAERQNKKAEEKPVKAAEGKPKYRKPVFVCAQDGTHLKRYPSVSEASRATGYSTGQISNICRGEYRSKGEFTFRYEHEEDIVPRPRKKRENIGARKAVLQYTKDGQLVARHGSITEAASAVGSCMSSVSKCCNGFANEANGFVFRFESELSEFEKLKG